VREDYSPDGNCWDYFPHDHARSRAYRWGEDGLLGFTDRECRLCFGLALWNGVDPILKERLFGVTGPEGNHGEDVKEQYFYLDSTPTHSYVKSLYKYPHDEFPYEWLVEENRRRGRHEDEFELCDSGVFRNSRYFDVQAEYAKGGPDDILIRITVSNRGAQRATLHLLPTLWYRNTWIWGCLHEGCWLKPRIERSVQHEHLVQTEHQSLGKMIWAIGAGPDGKLPPLLFTENETNTRRLFGVDNYTPYVKDAFHRCVIDGETEAVNPRQVGTKVAAHYVLNLAGGESQTVHLRLFNPQEPVKQDRPFDGCGTLMTQRRREADLFYDRVIPKSLTADQHHVARQAYAGLLHTKQFYHYSVGDWLAGDPNMPPPPESRQRGRNADWGHLFNRDIISMPDKWEYPWYAAWDLAFHMIPFAKIDPHFAKEQLVLFLREWYMHPNGQIPAYEFALGDVNPPVHAWACWRVYKMTGARGQRDVTFLARTFQKLLINFTWWVNRKDVSGKHIFAGGFLGLDNIGVFDRSRPLPDGHQLDQADGTAWMAFYCLTMLSMALELAEHDPAYEDVASKFFEHFVAIADAMNTLGGDGLWNEQDGFYYDQLRINSTSTPLRVRSMVGLIPLIAVEVLEEQTIQKLPGFRKRMQWFLDHRRDLARHISYMETDREGDPKAHHLLAIPSRERLERVLQTMLDEREFLSPFGLRSLSKHHEEHPYTLDACGEQQRVEYQPGESRTSLFGGNSNWRGPIWFPVNFLLIEALERYHHFYGNDLQVEYPTGSGQRMNLLDIAHDLAHRLSNLFTAGDGGRRPCHGDDARFAQDDHWRELVHFYEYFHGETGKGLGASHQTGWTALVTRCLEKQLLKVDDRAPRVPANPMAAKVEPDAATPGRKRRKSESREPRL
jgi:hypothetical protein